MTPLFAMAVALLVAFEPWTAYASLVMTESLFLPAFTAFVLFLARMLDRPTLGRQLAVLASLALLAGIRPQGVALVGAVLGAVAINGLRAPPFRRTLLVYRRSSPVSESESVRRSSRWPSARTLPGASPAASSRDSSIRWGS